MKKKDKLLEEIAGLTQQLNTESLEFLKSQAATLVHNQEVRKRNASAAKAQVTRKAQTGNKKKPSEAPQPTVHIEQLKNRNYFDLCIRNSKLFMDVHEIKTLYKIAKTAGSPEEGAVRLYRWFKKERSDVLVDGSIVKENSPILKMIYHELLDTFSGG